MSCGPAEGLLKLAEKIDVVNTTIDTSLKTLTDGVANSAIITALTATVQGFADGILAKVKDHIPEFAKTKGMISDIQDIAGKILTVALAGEDLKNELTTLKQKYTGLDLGNIDLASLPDLLRSGALDLENICNKFPNFEQDGADIVLRGTPITFPDIDPVAIIRGHKLPEMIKPEFGFDVQRRVREAGEEYFQVVNPQIFGG
jgi:hypothetical protein